MCTCTLQYRYNVCALSLQRCQILLNQAIGNAGFPNIYRLWMYCLQIMAMLTDDFNAYRWLYRHVMLTFFSQCNFSGNVRTINHRAVQKRRPFIDLLTNTYKKLTISILVIYKWTIFKPMILKTLFETLQNKREKDYTIIWRSNECDCHREYQYFFLLKNRL